MKDPETELGRRVRERRLQLGMSALQVSEATGGLVGLSQVSLIETGRRRGIKLAQAVALASALGMSLAELADAEASDGYAAGYTAGRRDAINEAIDLLQANKAGRSS